ncbi:DUF4411 family protein [Corynebacterium riegelii]
MTLLTHPWPKSGFTPHVCFHQEVDKELQRWAHPRLGWYRTHVQQRQIVTPDQLEIDRYAAVANWVQKNRQPSYKPFAVTDFFAAADSWLVASAYRHGAIIVTAEVGAPNGVKKVKIPDVAQHFNVPVITPLDFLHALQISV